MSPAPLASETILLQENGVLVTTARLEAGGTMHPIRSIGSVRVEPDHDAGVAAFVTIFLLGMIPAGIFGWHYGASAGFGLLGCIGVTAALVMALLARRKIVVVVAGGDRTVLTHPDTAFVSRVVAAINEAVAMQATAP